MAIINRDRKIVFFLFFFHARIALINFLNSKLLSIMHSFQIPTRDQRMINNCCLILKSLDSLSILPPLLLWHEKNSLICPQHFATGESAADRPKNTFLSSYTSIAGIFYLCFAQRAIASRPFSSITFRPPIPLPSKSANHT